MKRFASDRVAGLMERMGLEDDCIESRIVSKTIESAQTRVEGFNFDIRKRVVEFDDVINKQRETIYAERDKVLRNEDLGETIRASSTRRSTRWSSSTAPTSCPRSGTSRAWSSRSTRWASTARGPARTTCGRSARARRSASTCASWSTRSWRPRRPRSARRLAVRRAGRPPPDDRQPVGRAPDRAGRHAPGHRPARLRPAGPPRSSSGARPTTCTPSCAASSATSSRRRSCASRSPARILPPPSRRCPVRPARCSGRRRHAAPGRHDRPGRPGGGRGQRDPGQHRPGPAPAPAVRARHGAARRRGGRRPGRPERLRARSGRASPPTADGWAATTCASAASGLKYKKCHGR